MSSVLFCSIGSLIWCREKYDREKSETSDRSILFCSHMMFDRRLDWIFRQWWRLRDVISFILVFGDLSSTAEDRRCCRWCWCLLMKDLIDPSTCSCFAPFVGIERRRQLLSKFWQSRTNAEMNKGREKSNGWSNHQFFLLPQNIKY